MTVYTFNPLDDGRWREFVDRHASGSVFHTAGWISALRQTYGYQPIVFTTSPPDRLLRNGILLCGVHSWLTGQRLVSVPFADHCEPLVSVPDERAAIIAALRAPGRGKYVELRPRTSTTGRDLGFTEATSFRLHVLDLQRSLPDLYGAFHESGVRRKIRRAEREGVTCQVGRSEALLRAFYRLTVLTRRRHGIPPAPIAWFRNLIGCLGDNATIRLAVKEGREIGGILTLQHGNTLTYKYGCSNARFHHLGTMPFLFWNAIRDAKAAGLEAFDLGRSDLENTGLAIFKERLGATVLPLTYLRSPGQEGHGLRRRGHLPAWIIRRAPDRLLVAAGKLLYKHIG